MSIHYFKTLETLRFSNFFNFSITDSDSCTTHASSWTNLPFSSPRGPLRTNYISLKINLQVQFAIQNAQHTKHTFQQSLSLIQTELSFTQVRYSYRILLIWVGQWKTNDSSPASFFIHLLVYMDSYKPVFKVLYKNRISELSNTIG